MHLKISGRVPRRKGRWQEKVLGPVHPNLGLEAEYRRQLQLLVGVMHRSLVYWLRARWRSHPPVTLAADELPAHALQAEVRRLARRWASRFDEAAPRLAKYFATHAADRAEGRLARILEGAGFVVDFRLTPMVRDVVTASVNENVSLIKSIGAEHLADVEQLVARSVAAGRDLATLTKELEARYELTRKRAALIARDQNNKATSAVARARMIEAGVVEAVWMHSHAGKTPRPSHVKMNGKRFDVAKGMWDPDEKKWIQPGWLINCRCTSRPVVPGFD